MRARRLGWVVALAVGMAAVGWLAGRGIESPADAARRAQAPAASPITVPVQRRVIESSVVVRGDVSFAEEFALAVDPDLGDGTLGQLVVTGRLPVAGSQLGEGAVALEVSGRPTFLLAGVLPMYRGLRPGSVGNDVRQLEEALRRLGHFTGSPDSTYDQATAAAVKRLYDAAGYAPIGLSAAERQQLAAAQGQVKSAQAAQQTAAAALAQALQGPPGSAVLAAQGAVEQAQLALDRARDEYDEAVAGGASPGMLAELAAKVAAAQNQLDVAEATLAELIARADTGDLELRLADAIEEVGAARAGRAELSATLGFRLPRGEIVFVPSLPRQVGPFDVKLGAAPAGTVVRLTAASVQVDIAISAEEQKLVTVGAPVRLDDTASSVELTGLVAFVAESPGTDGAPPGSYYARIEPLGADPQKINGLNLRVSIPIRSTGGPVLAVPVAALVTDGAGSVTVRVRRGSDVNGGDVDVAVNVGLAADGFAQVTPVDGALAEGDLVIVGHQW